MDPIYIILIALAVVLMVAALVVRSRRPDRSGSSASAPTAPAPTAPTAPTPALASRLARTREALGGRLRGLFSGSMDTAFWEGLEEALIAADVGVTASTEVVARVRERKPADTTEARRALRDELLNVLDRDGRDLALTGRPAVVIVVGVNGTGKTTSIAKLAGHLKSQGLEPLLGAADTFRAAADQQLRTWAARVGVEVVGGQAGADPASVAFDAYQAARARGRDVVIIDTAGRLHSKTNLMDELGKVVRVVARAADAIDEVLLVLDATTGQNGIAQVRQFTEAVGVTGIVLTKLDGTARGGVAIAVERELGMPVKFIGVGEGIDDLIPFEPIAFVDALLEDA
jgi:fused signal recognition particle receptor